MKLQSGFPGSAGSKGNSRMNRTKKALPLPLKLGDQYLGAKPFIMVVPTKLECEVAGVSYRWYVKDPGPNGRKRDWPGTENDGTIWASSFRCPLKKLADCTVFTLPEALARSAAAFKVNLGILRQAASASFFWPPSARRHRSRPKCW